MGGLSIWHWIIVIAVVLLLFGRGKISELMGDVAQGIKSFKKGMAEDENAKTEPPKPEPEDDRPPARAAGAAGGAEPSSVAERTEKRARKAGAQVASCWPA